MCERLEAQWRAILFILFLLFNQQLSTLRGRRWKSHYFDKLPAGLTKAEATALSIANFLITFTNWKVYWKSLGQQVEFMFMKQNINQWSAIKFL